MAEQKCLQMAAWHEGGQGCRPCRAGKRDTQALLLDPCSPPAPRNHDSGASGVGRPLNTAVSPLRAPEDPRGPCLQQDRWPARAGSSRSPAGAMIGSGGGQPEARPGGGGPGVAPHSLPAPPLLVQRPSPRQCAPHRVMALDTSSWPFSLSSKVMRKGLSRARSFLVRLLPARPRTNQSPWNCERR